MNFYLIIAQKRKESQMEDDYIENDEGNIFELINEECFYDDKWREENEQFQFI